MQAVLSKSLTPGEETGYKVRKRRETNQDTPAKAPKPTALVPHGLRKLNPISHQMSCRPRKYAKIIQKSLLYE
jgi:hypothetical protein